MGKSHYQSLPSPARATECTDGDRRVFDTHQRSGLGHGSQARDSRVDLPPGNLPFMNRLLRQGSPSATDRESPVREKVYAGTGRSKTPAAYPGCPLKFLGTYEKGYPRLRQPAAAPIRKLAGRQQPTLRWEQLVQALRDRRGIRHVPTGPRHGTRRDLCLPSPRPTPWRRA